MSRRASSSLHPAVIIAIAVVVVIVIIGGKSLLKRKPTGFADANPLNVEEFLQDGNSLRGNVYAVEGKIDDKLRWTTNRGQVVSLMVTVEGKEPVPIPVEIPQEFNHLNIEREQRYAMRIKVRQQGIPVATDVKRL